MSEGFGLFVYGTLRFPEILRILLGRAPGLSSARADGWRVRALPDLVYPGLVAAPDGVAEGMLITDLTTAESRLLDAYENDIYVPTVIGLDKGRRGRAYVWKGPVEPFDWDPDAFAEHHLTSYAEGCRLWRRDHERRTAP
ncbi:gamma-glutamylcyclotransferase family protein [Spirillospora sp. CA-294931]|uniref:gamma-glutamylcyclotransferase family protein n=1 Tax=Spirillospora sp. CA-294931 TaxID=3240042 RepID=UPI003D92261E